MPTSHRWTDTTRWNFAASSWDLSCICSRVPVQRQLLLCLFLETAVHACWWLSVNYWWMDVWIDVCSQQTDRVKSKKLSKACLLLLVKMGIFLHVCCAVLLLLLDWLVQQTWHLHIHILKPIWSTVFSSPHQLHNYHNLLVMPVISSRLVWVQMGEDK